MTTFKLPFERMREFVVAGIDAAWADESTKAAWRRDWLAEFDRLAPTVVAYREPSRAYPDPSRAA